MPGADLRRDRVKIAGVALISTVYREAKSVRVWLDALAAQTAFPEEFVIVDGGSPDDTVEQITAYQWPAEFPPPHIIVEPCNIARGRNLAILNTSADIVASTDAGSCPEKTWLEEITRPLLKDAECDAVGGKSIVVAENSFHEMVLKIEGQSPDDDGFYPSSRNVALRRKAWQSVGGYPEWLTLAGEDALYNFELHAAGNRFVCNNRAVVRWPVRPTPDAYFKLLYRNAFGAAEADLYSSFFWRCLMIMSFPPLLLLSRHRHRYLAHRFRKNASSALGWLAGKVVGRRAPAGWLKLDGIWLSPEAQASRPPRGK